MGMDRLCPRRYRSPVPTEVGWHGRWAAGWTHTHTALARLLPTNASIHRLHHTSLTPRYILLPNDWILHICTTIELYWTFGAILNIINLFPFCPAFVYSASILWHPCSVLCLCFTPPPTHRCQSRVTITGACHLSSADSLTHTHTPDTPTTNVNFVLHHFHQ